jgi:adenylate kinase
VSAERQIILLVGAVGAGKGTQAAILERRLGLPHIASGDLFRAAVQAGTPLGRQAGEYMARGDLVPDSLTIAMFMVRLAEPDAAGGAILDGFPRTATQAAALDATLAERSEQIERLIFIEVPTEELVRRVAHRLVCPSCGTPYHFDDSPPRVAGRCDRDGTPLLARQDDQPAVVRARLANQVPPMLEVVEHYERLGLATRVDGSQPVERVTDAILAVLPGAVVPDGS